MARKFDELRAKMAPERRLLNEQAATRMEESTQHPAGGHETPGSSPTSSPDIAKQPCPECGGGMAFEERPEVLSYRGWTRTIETLGWWCERCGEGILSGSSLEAHEAAFRAFKTEVEGVSDPAEDWVHELPGRTRTTS